MQLVLNKYIVTKEMICFKAYLRERVFLFVLLGRNESLSNKYEKWFKVNLIIIIIIIIIILKLWFLYYNGIFLRNHYFHLMEIRFSASQRLGKHCYGHVTVSLHVAEHIWLPRGLLLCVLFC